MLITVNPKYQWIVAATLPFAREVILWILVKIGIKSSGAEDHSVEIFQSFALNCRHLVFLSATLGSAISDLSSWILIGGDTIFNLCLALKITVMKRRRGFHKSMKSGESLLVSLTINVLVALVISPTFLICLLLAYYGPNSRLLGNIKSSHFHYMPIENIHRYVVNICYFFATDLFTTFGTALWLWYMAGINLAKANICLQKEF